VIFKLDNSFVNKCNENTIKAMNEWLIDWIIIQIKEYLCEISGQTMSSSAASK